MKERLFKVIKTIKNYTTSHLIITALSSVVLVVALVILAITTVSSPSKTIRVNSDISTSTSTTLKSSSTTSPSTISPSTTTGTTQVSTASTSEVVTTTTVQSTTTTTTPHVPSWHEVPFNVDLAGYKYFDNGGSVTDVYCPSVQLCFLSGFVSNDITNSTTYPVDYAVVEVSHDFGVTWKAVLISGMTYASDVRCVSLEVCDAVAYPGYSDSGETLFRTTDGGSTWSIDKLSGSLTGMAPNSGTLNCVFGTQVCYAVFDGNSPDGHPSFSYDGGLTWSTPDSSIWTTGISCSTSGFCMGDVLIPQDNNAVAIYSTDFGKTWNDPTANYSFNLDTYLGVEFQCITANTCIWLGYDKSTGSSAYAIVSYQNGSLTNNIYPVFDTSKVSGPIGLSCDTSTCTFYGTYEVSGSKGNYSGLVAERESIAVNQTSNTGSLSEISIYDNSSITPQSNGMFSATSVSGDSIATYEIYSPSSSSPTIGLIAYS